MSPAAGWTRLTVEVTTPLFNPGAAAGAVNQVGVRPSAIRGVMRFWFRALAGIVAGPDTSLLSSLDEEVFGSMARPSSVVIRVPVQPALSRQPFLPTGPRARAGGWTAYMLGPRLTAVRTRGTAEVTEPYVPPGATFDICLRARTRDQLDDARTALALASLWLTCAYGGIGARTRRGFGGLRITAADGQLPAPWTTQNVLSPGLGHYERITRLWPTGPVGECVRHLGSLAERHGATLRLAQWDASPPYPVLSRTRTLAGVSGGEAFLNWADVAEYAGEQLRRFRARASRSAQGPEPATPREALFGSSNRFPQGALGLPIMYPEMTEVNVYQDKRIPLRRPSQLWLRPVGEGDQWRLLSFAFFSQFLPGSNPPEVLLRAGGRQLKVLTVADDDIVTSATEWITTLAADETFD